MFRRNHVGVLAADGAEATRVHVVVEIPDRIAAQDRGAVSGRQAIPQFLEADRRLDVAGLQSTSTISP